MITTLFTEISSPRTCSSEPFIAKMEDNPLNALRHSVEKGSEQVVIADFG
jgi:hypothetical protein